MRRATVLGAGQAAFALATIITATSSSAQTGGINAQGLVCNSYDAAVSPPPANRSVTV